MSMPAWIESPAIQALLHRLVDKLDAAAQRDSARAQSVALNSLSWPELYLSPMESDKEFLWEQLQGLQFLGWVRITPESAARSEGGYDQKPRLSVLNATALRKATGRLERPKSASQRWREAVEMHLDATDDVKKAVAEFCLDIPHKDTRDVVLQLNELRHLAQEPLLLREVSAKLFWGMSKVLDQRSALVAALLQTDECPFAESPVQLQVYLPAENFDGVLFIENLTSFEQALRAKAPASRRLALAYAAGFKASAARLRTPGTVSLFFSQLGELGKPSVQRFTSWLFEEPARIPVFFWGDLDWEGMQILAAMRRNFSHITAWQPGYKPMLDSLNAGQGHTAEAANKKGQRPIAATGCGYSDTQLIPGLVKHNAFVDQERFGLQS